jgi:hypothetical protein
LAGWRGLNFCAVGEVFCVIPEVFGVGAKFVGVLFDEVNDDCLSSVKLS